MFLARVTGTVVCTQKDKTLNGQKLFIVEPLNLTYDGDRKPTGFGNTVFDAVAPESVLRRGRL